MKKSSLSLNTLLARFSYGPRVRAVRDWSSLLLFAALLLIFSVGWNLWLLQKAEQGELVGVEPAIETFDAAPIERVRTMFEERALEQQRYQNEYRFVDPSR